MASSTTTPVASTRPNRVKALRVPPLSFSTVKLPTRATGMATAVISAKRQLPSPSSSTANTSSTASRRAAIAWLMLSCTLLA